MYRWLNNSNLPGFLKFLLKVLLTLSCIYWIGWFVYKILDCARAFIHWTTDKGHFWVFMFCLVLVTVWALVLAENYLGLEPFAKILSWIMEKVQEIREKLGNFVNGIISGK